MIFEKPVKEEMSHFHPFVPHETNQTAKDDVRIKPLLIYILLITMTVAAYSNVMGFDFVNIDDPVYVAENLHIQSGFTSDSLCWAFSDVYAGFWHPLTLLSLMLDYCLFGLNAGGYHLTNLILHMISSLLLFWLFKRMTDALWSSFFIAAFFALHPLHVESVVWIAERKDVLSAFFWMLTLCFYVHYAEKPGLVRYFLVLLSFACGLMSKSMVLTLPVILILLDFWPLGRLNHQSRTKTLGFIPLWQLKEKAPLFILSAIFSAATLHAQLPVKHIPLDLRLANAPISFVAYLSQIFWPLDLAVFYPFPAQFPAWKVLGSIILILIITFFVLRAAKRFPCLFVGWFWYAVTILPVLGIIQIGEFAMADRFTYLPSIGLSIMIAWGGTLMIKTPAMRRRILFPAGAVFLVSMSFLTFQQSGHWRDSVSLFEHALKVTRNNDLALNNLGKALIEKGRSEEAVDLFNKIISRQKNDPVAYYNRGNAYYHGGHYQMSVDDYSRAIRLYPNYINALNNRGGSYTKLGQYQMAIDDYKRIILLKPDYVAAYYNIGNIYALQGRQGAAIEKYSKAIRMNPGHVSALKNRGFAYLNQGDKKNGCLDFQRSCAVGFCDALLWAKDQGICF